MCIVNLQRLLDDSDVFAFFYMDKVVEIQNRIYDVRGVKVMFDFDLALLYKIETRVLNQAVKRNLNRFPEDFMFQLTSFEWEQMSSQIVTTSCKRPKSAAPFVFTEHGVIMLASVLRSDTAVQASVKISPPTASCPRNKIGFKTSADEKK